MKFLNKNMMLIRVGVGVVGKGGKERSLKRTGGTKEEVCKEGKSVEEYGQR